VLFTLVHAGKYSTYDKLNIQTIHRLNISQIKQMTQNTTKQNYPGFVSFYDTQPGNEIGLIYNAPKPTRGKLHSAYKVLKHECEA